MQDNVIGRSNVGMGNGQPRLATPFTATHTAPYGSLAEAIAGLWPEPLEPRQTEGRLQ